MSTAFNDATNKAPIIPPDKSKKKWKSKIFTEIGASKINAKGTHFLRMSNIPTYTSKAPTMGNIYPEAFKDPIKTCAFGGIEGCGRKPESMKIIRSLFAPNTMRITPSTKRIILVKLEFIGVKFCVSVLSRYEKDTGFTKYFR